MVADHESTNVRKRVRYLSAFALRHHSAFRPHFRYGQTLGKGEDFRNVGEHCLMAGVFANLIVRHMKLSPKDVHTVTHAAILHDWFKKHEVTYRKEFHTARSIKDALDRAKQVDHALLMEMGFPQDVVELTQHNLPLDKKGPETDPQKILMYVDMMLRDTEPVPILDRMNESFAKEHVRAWSEAYAEDCGESLESLERRLGPEVEHYLAQRIGCTEGASERLPAYLRALLEEEVRTWKPSEKGI